MDAVVIRSDVKKALERFESNGEIFDFVFVDPPYEKGMAQETIISVLNGRLLSSSGVMAVTVRHSEKLPERIGEFEIIFDRRYGDTRLTVYKIKQ